MNLIARVVCCASVLLITGCASGPTAGLLGAYRFEDGRIVSIRRSVDNTLRYRVYPTGESKRLHPEGDFRYVAGGFSSKDPLELRVAFDFDETSLARRILFEPVTGPAETAVRIGRAEDVRFTSDAVEFVGRLDLPAGDGPYPAIVLVHGSGSDAATQFMYNGDFLAPHGIAVLTFDKRGTGRSGGDYTFDFHQLARDVVAAVNYLKTRRDIDGDRIGLSGYSQGGWVAPLAASVSPDVHFVLVSCGLVESPAEEARVETRNELRKRGVDEASLSEVDELTLAAVAVIASGFKDGWDEFDSVKRRTDDASWRKKLSGTVIGDFVKYPKWLIKLLGKRRAPHGLPWYYDSNEVLRSLDIPMVWFIAGDDEMAPPELAIPALETLIDAGKPYELVVFDGTDHGMLMFQEDSDARHYTGYDPEYSRREVQAARYFTGLAPGVNGVMSER
jgi:pimeloyl-ACP methyl ester carboxylesterase